MLWPPRFLAEACTIAALEHRSVYLRRTVSELGLEYEIVAPT